jgi:hypothetical protein
MLSSHHIVNSTYIQPIHLVLKCRSFATEAFGGTAFAGYSSGSGF